MRARRIKYRPAPADSSPVSTRLSHPPQAPARRAAAGERGIALVVAIIVLLVLSMIAAALMMSLNVETHISGHDERRTEALSVAEAGIAEGISRIRSGEVPDTLNPRMTSQIYLVTAGNVPVLGPDSTGLATAQPVGKWLNYTTAGRGPQALTVTYKTDPGRTAVYRYDPTQNPAVQTTSGSPIFVITSTGKVGSDTRTVVSEVFKKPVNINAKGALTANNEVHWIGGNAAVCGYNHKLTTATGAGADGRFGAFSCIPYEVGTDNVFGCWSTDSVYSGGTSDEAGDPAPDISNQTGFYAGPWEVIGMTQADFMTWIGPPQSTTPATPTGPIYLDNDGVTQNVSGSFNYGGVTGDGFLYVDGDMNLSSSFVYKGVIYIEGDLSFTGHAWILGAVIVRGAVHPIKVGGGGTVLYSKDAIDVEMSKYASKFSTLSFREK